jgi:UDP-N-acetylmuramoyl-L-alanyl-D-glutamate--2,6-diaminopimelate ligase
VFLAVAGTGSDGHEFADAAVTAGAVAVLAEHPVKLQSNVAVVVVPDLGNRRGEIAARFHGYPSNSLYCVGITGTNGKTSVACHVAELASGLGQSAGYIGTIGWGRMEQLEAATLTTESAVTTQKRLAAIRAAGAVWVAMEVSSHALAQARVCAVDFDVGVFTNLSRDHLDYHGDLASYGAAKAKLFESVKMAVVNSDDAFGRELAQHLRSIPVVTYGASGDVRWRDLEFSAGGVRGTWETPWGNSEFSLPLYGEFSVANMAAAICVLCQAGLPFIKVLEAAEQVTPVAGRMEFFRGSRDVVVDFAHTPDALEKMLEALRPHVTGRLVCVFGCGGDRDPGKRPLMAHAAEQHADVVWLTSDNPRSEDPEVILQEMRAGLSDATEVHVCVDRRQAIELAIGQADAADLVVVAGKGHEDYQEIAGRRLAFSDREIVQRLVSGEPSPDRKES